MRTKTYEELTIADDFMFCKILQDNPDLTKELLELILDVPMVRMIKTYLQNFETF